MSQIAVARIWSAAKHNAFTDLIRFRGTWYCSFRESSGHAVWDGHVRIIRSDNGEAWSAAAYIACPAPLEDLRDPKLSITPDGRLMLTAAAYQPVCQTFTFFSDDGTTWSEGNAVGPRGVWLWRTVWHRGWAYNFGRSESEEDRYLQLYRSSDGVGFLPLGPRQFAGVYANETAPIFLQDETCLTLLRRDSDPAMAQLGIARPPYESWTWRDLGIRIGGPAMIQLPDGRLLAVVRLYDEPRRTALCWLDAAAATLTESLTLPSRGDTSYAGLVWHEETLWISYYSSDEETSAVEETSSDVDGDNQSEGTSIYLARLSAPELTRIALASGN